jgi:NhaA family Na+:H+ antiporter
LPFGVTWLRFFSASWLAGIGFTMALFIASSAFVSPELLAASLLASIGGFALIILTSPVRERESRLEEAPAQA